ncbi:3345_t:CDS:2 [Entrophospora sp. SA101]|nr:12425_t:CDS:2 [Entrophospora sp. SA101]CAJ0745971.1 3345_t:CDS:2 [Entrophospora sp. SA101]
MDTGDVQVQHQPFTQDPIRQSWSNNNSNSKQYSQNSTKSSITTPKISQNFIAQPKSVAFINKNSSQLNSSKSSPLPSYNNNNNLSKSPPKSNKNIITTVQQKTTNYNRSIPKPLNLSKTTQFQNLARAPQTATFPQKINRSYNLLNPPKTATFPKHSNGFPKDIRQPTLRLPTTSPSTTNNSQHAYTLMCNEQNLNALELTRNINYNSNSIPVRFTTANCHQVEPSPGTSVVVLNHPDDSDSQGSSPPTPRFLSSENSSDSTDIYDFQLQKMKDVKDAILPIRQPKGPEMSKNFATRIRRKAVSKLHAAAANRRRKSAADRRKSAMF